MTDKTLPGVKALYFLRSGMGERYLWSDQLVTLLARPQDTGGLLEAAIISGGANATLPLHSHLRAHESFYVPDGRLELHLAGNCYRLSRGDYANIPPNTTHGYRMLSHYTRLLVWSVGGDITKLYSTVGIPYAGFVIPEVVPPALSADSFAAAEAAGDIRFARQEFPPQPDCRAIDTHVPPATMQPYVLAAGEGERLIAGDQLFAFLSHQGNSNGSFITLTTVGPNGDRIPDHFHEKHTETFFCLDGILTMWANGEEVRLLPGDFLHVPPGTIHAYRLDAPFTRFVGLLAPGLFEPFFRTFCDPYGGYIFPQSPKPARFDRVIQKLQELDLKLVGPPR
jgi:quercetin 2,3-dioxygenase